MLSKRKTVDRAQARSAWFCGARRVVWLQMAMRAVGEAGLLPPPYAQMYEQAQRAMKCQQEQQQQQQQQQQQGQGQQGGQPGQQQQQQIRGASALPAHHPPRQPSLQPPPFMAQGLGQPKAGSASGGSAGAGNRQMSYYDPPAPLGFDQQLPYEQPHLFDQLLSREQVHMRVCWVVLCAHVDAHTVCVCAQVCARA